MRALFLIAGATLALAACGRDDGADTNALTGDNLMVEDNGLAGTEAGGIDGNLDTNAATENAMVTDLTTNDADTNLANGM